MAWTAPASAVTNTVITANFWNEFLRDDENYLNTNMSVLLSLITSDGINPIHFSSISTAYKHLKFIGLLRSTAVSTSKDLVITVNGTQSYYYEYFSIDGAASQSAGGGALVGNITLTNAICGANAPTNTYSCFEMNFYNYLDTNLDKSFFVKVDNRLNTAATSDFHNMKAWGHRHSNQTITDVTFDGNILNTNSSISMYGML